MEPFRHHVFVCTQQKPEGVTCCPASGSMSVLGALHGELGKQGLSDDVQVTTCGCLGLCDDGPIMIVYPEGVWYRKLTPADVPEIVASHLCGGSCRIAPPMERSSRDEGRWPSSTPRNISPW